jgi:hypothetical protein
MWALEMAKQAGRLLVQLLYYFSLLIHHTLIPPPASLYYCSSSSLCFAWGVESMASTSMAPADRTAMPVAANIAVRKRNTGAYIISYRIYRYVQVGVSDRNS